jgi:hypothetical protein
VIKKKIRLNLQGEKVILTVNGKDAINALGELYENLTDSIGDRTQSNEAGYAAINMFLNLFGEEITEKLLLYCEKKPEKAMRKYGRLIRRVLYPLCVRQRRQDDRRGVRKYL